MITLHLTEDYARQLELSLEFAVDEAVASKNVLRQTTFGYLIKLINITRAQPAPPVLPWWADGYVNNFIIPCYEKLQTADTAYVLDILHQILIAAAADGCTEAQIALDNVKEQTA